jgi:hypothetical protein
MLQDRGMIGGFAYSLMADSIDSTSCTYICNCTYISHRFALLRFTHDAHGRIALHLNPEIDLEDPKIF